MARLSQANLNQADLSQANLSCTQIIWTDLRGASLCGSRVYGASVWDIKVDDQTKQGNLIITGSEEAAITVDNIKVAQFIYLLLTNKEIRYVIDTITSKGVLILGGFSEERKAVLDAIREELRKHDYLPILFDFDVPENRDITETVSLLARMARFIIADLTDPSSIPKELEAIVPSHEVPVQPLLEGLATPYSMFKDYWRYEWVLPPYRYATRELLLSTLAKKVIAPAEAKVKERRRAIEVELTAPRTSA
jgi:Pentapeptide repeats (8 copies)